MRRRPSESSISKIPALGFTLAILFSLALAGDAAAQTLAQKKASARAQSERAAKLRTALEGRPQDERTLAEHQRVISTFRRVYLITPHAVEAPASLVAIAELYQEMGRRFDPKFFQSAIDAYQFLLHEYPTHRFRDDALFTIGQVQRQELNQLDAAELTFQEFLRRFPGSSKAEQARQALAEIAAAREEERKESSRKALAEQREQQQKMPRVTNIRHWNAENSTRVVVDLEDVVQFQAHRIANPDRIYFDLHTARLSPTLAGKTLEVQSGFLNSIRVAQNQAGVVRVVFEVANIKDYSAFLLPNPHRLVVDIYGEQPEAPRTQRAAAKAPEKVEPEPVKAEKAASPAAEPSAKSVAAAEKQPEAAPPTPPQPTRNGQHSLTRALGLKAGRIVIDAGHGGHDTGTVGPTGLMEKDLSLDLAVRLGKMIQEQLPGTEVIYTREDDAFVPLESRTALANQVKADLFLSIHANASRDRQARGIETYYLSFSTSDEAMEVAARENALSQSSIHELQDIIKKIARNEKVEESREIRHESIDVLFGGVPRAHETAAAATDERVKEPTLAAKWLDHVERELCEHRVRLPGEEQTHLGKLRERDREAFRHGVRVARVREPGAVFEHPDPRRGEKSHLRAELTGLLAAVVELARELAVEEHHRFAAVAAVFGAAEAENVDTELPGDLFRFRAEAGNGIGEPSPIHVQRESEFAALLADRPELVERVHGAHLRRLRETHRARLRVVDVGAFPHPLFDAVRIDLAVLAGNLKHLHSVREELGGTALVGFDVRNLVTQDAVIRLPHGGERQSVGCGAVEYEKDLAVRLEGVA